MVIAGIDPDPERAEAITHWTKAYWEAVHPGGAYPNFMMDDKEENRLRNTFGPNFEKFVTIKRKYDPRNLFGVNQDIRP